MAAETEKAAEGGDGKPPSAGKGGFVIALLLLAVIGAGAGAGFSLMFLRAEPAEHAPAAMGTPEADKAAAKGEAGKPAAAKPDGDGRKEQVATLEPILVTLSGPQRAWARLELGVIIADEPKDDPALLLKTITEDLMAFMRTVPLAHVENAAGIEYLREDLSEIVRLRSKGRARGVVLRSLVVE